MLLLVNYLKWGTEGPHFYEPRIKQDLTIGNKETAADEMAPRAMLLLGCLFSHQNGAACSEASAVHSCARGQALCEEAQ